MLADPSPALRVAALEYVGRERLTDLQEWVSGCQSDADPAVQQGRPRDARSAAGGRGRGRHGRAHPGAVRVEGARGSGAGGRGDRPQRRAGRAAVGAAVRRGVDRAPRRPDGGGPARAARVLAADHQRARVARALRHRGRVRSSLSASARCRRRSGPSTRRTRPRASGSASWRSTRRWAGRRPRRCWPTSSAFPTRACAPRPSWRSAARATRPTPRRAPGGDPRDRDARRPQGLEHERGARSRRRQPARAGGAGARGGDRGGALPGCSSCSRSSTTPGRSAS